MNRIILYLFTVFIWLLILELTGISALSAQTPEVSEGKKINSEILSPLQEKSSEESYNIVSPLNDSFNATMEPGETREFEAVRIGSTVWDLFYKYRTIQKPLFVKYTHNDLTTIRPFGSTYVDFTLKVENDAPLGNVEFMVEYGYYTTGEPDDFDTLTIYLTISTDEIISVPNIPVGQEVAHVGETVSISSGGSESNLGHTVEYQYDWGDGVLSDWGNSNQSHIYSSSGFLEIRARARCQVHTGVYSGWSDTKTVSVNDLPDLVASFIDFNPTSGEAGSTLNIDVTVKNTGTGMAGSSILRYYLSESDFVSPSDWEIGFDVVPALSAGSESEQSLSWKIPADLVDGTYYIGCIVDADLQVTELNEGNSFCLKDKTFEKTTPAIPDLTLTHGGINPGEGGLGTSLNVKVTAKNIGDGPAGECTLEFFLCLDPDISVLDFPIGSARVPALNPGEDTEAEITITVDESIQPDSYYFGFELDSEKEVEESDEWNYFFLPGVQFNRLPDPDLTVTSMSFSPDTARSGDNLNVGITLKNLDSGSSGTFKVKYYLSADAVITNADILIGTTTVSNLEGLAEINSDIDKTIGNSLPDGIYYLGCIVDPNDEVSETNENNNVFCFSSPLLKDDLPDILSLSPSGISTSTMDSKPELTVTFSEKIEEGSGCLTIYQKIPGGEDKLVRDKECWEGRITDNSITFRLSTGLDRFAEHYVLLDAGFVSDLNGNQFEGISDKTVWTFKTGDFPTEVPEITRTDFKIYPNPAHDKVSIQFPDTKAPYIITLVDIAGHVVAQRETTSAIETIDLSNVPGGVYLLKVNNQNHYETWKLIVQ